MKVLAFDTSTDALSVALRMDEQTLVSHALRPREQATALLPTIARLLGDAGLVSTALDAVVFGRGPGSFTGVRIAVAAAQGYAWAADLPVLGISTLAAIAEGCRREHGDRDVLAMLDARMGELYLGRYRSDDGGPMRAVGEEGVVPADRAALAGLDRRIVLAGSGLRALGGGSSSVEPDAGAARTSPVERVERLPHAVDLLALADARLVRGELDPPALAQPVYLRDRVALTEAERGVV